MISTTKELITITCGRDGRLSLKKKVQFAQELSERVIDDDTEQNSAIKTNDGPNDDAAKLDKAIVAYLEENTLPDTSSVSYGGCVARLKFIIKTLKKDKHFGLLPSSARLAPKCHIKLQLLLRHIKTTIKVHQVREIGKLRATRKAAILMSAFRGWAETSVREVLVRQNAVADGAIDDDTASDEEYSSPPVSPLVHCCDIPRDEQSLQCMRRNDLNSIVDAVAMERMLRRTAQRAQRSAEFEEQHVKRMVRSLQIAVRCNQEMICA